MAQEKPPDERLNDTEGGREREKSTNWTGKKAEAAILLAEDELADWEIAKKLDIGRATLSRWKLDKEFQGKVSAHVKRIGNSALRYAIAKVSRRVADLDDKWRRLNQVLDKRAADPELATVPGGVTGIVVRRERALGSGDNQKFVFEYEVDVATLREIRETLKQAAIECNQWQERMDLTGAGVPFKTYIGIDTSKV